MTRILITGASGFIGAGLVPALAQAGCFVRAADRQSRLPVSANVEPVVLPDLRQPIDWAPLLDSCDAVIHLAGLAHTGEADAALYDRINRLATAELARAAKAAGADLIFLSSIRAQTGPTAQAIVSEAAAPHPTDAYGRSKLAAEEAIRDSGVTHTIFRPVVVYGPGVKGNMAALVRLAALPLPLPFARFDNRRSLLARDNLVAAITFALGAPAARNETFIVADPSALTLAEIVTTLRAAAARPPMLMPVRPALIERALRTLGRGDLWERLGAPLVADAGKLCAAGWQPVTDTHAALAALVQAASPRKSGTASRSTL